MTLPLYTGFDTARERLCSSSSCAPWIERFNVNYHLGVDGISLLFILLNSFTTVLVVIAGWEVIQKRVAQYMAAFLILSGLMNGVFCRARRAAVLRVLRGDADPDVHHHRRVGRAEPRLRGGQVLPLHAARLAADAGRADLPLQRSPAAASRSSTSTSCRSPLTRADAALPRVLLAFAVKVPMWPVHTWLPDAHVEAPTGGSVVLAAIMLKLGAYGFLRFSLPILPDASHALAGFMIALSLIAVVYIGLVALVQTDMKKLIAYSSISHMGFVTLGFFIFNAHGHGRRAGADDLARLRLGRAVPVRRRAVRPHALAQDRRLRRRGQHHAGVRRVLHAVRHGQLRACPAPAASSASSW